jgi:exosortase/archaeosortase family protein
VGLFSVLWLDLIRQLSYQWSNNEQYAYGWFVPFLALGLFWRKWPTRPQVSGLIPHPSSRFQLSAFPISAFEFDVPESLSRITHHASRVTSPLSAFCFLLLLLLLPLRVIHETNQDWPLITWPLALIVVALTLYALHLADPQSVDRGPCPTASGPVVRGPISAFRFLLSALDWRSPWSVVSGQWSLFSPWVKHFAFPICFILVAVSWPYRIEHGLTQSLMRAVTALTVIVLGWVDILASQHGNVIEISTGAVGINEACSGIRSFQSMLMGALFLGELYRLRWPHRLALIGSGVVVAFGLNVVRTFILTWCASDAGIELVGRWHDPAGLSIFLASFACLWLLARRLEKHCAALDEEEAPGFMPTPQRSAEGEVQSPTSQVQSPMSQVQSPKPCSPRSIVHSPISAFYFLLSCFSSPRPFLTVAGCWAVCVLGLTELWYIAHEHVRKPPQRWSVILPATNSTFQTVALTPQVLASLKADENITGTWRQPDGIEWAVYFLRWNPNSVPSVIRARGHRPDRCLPNAGLREVSNLPIEYFEAGPWKLPFQRYIFEANQQSLYVFYCLWQDGDEAQQGMHIVKGLRVLSIPERLQLAWQGKRRLGQQTLEIVVSGCVDFQAAERAFQQRLPELVRLEPAQPSRRAKG